MNSGFKGGGEFCEGVRVQCRISLKGRWQVFGSERAGGGGEPITVFCMFLFYAVVEAGRRKRGRSGM